MRRDQIQTLSYVVDKIRSTLPGNSVTVHRKTLEAIGENAVDDVMQTEGFDREFSVFIDQRSKEVRFIRLSEPLADDDERRTYVATGQRAGFTFDGNYWRPADNIA